MELRTARCSGTALSDSDFKSSGLKSTSWKHNTDDEHRIYTGRRAGAGGGSRSHRGCEALACDGDFLVRVGLQVMMFLNHRRKLLD
eukprot:1540268-Rhodomonas_salina.1